MGKKTPLLILSAALVILLVWVRAGSTPRRPTVATDVPRASAPTAPVNVERRRAVETPAAKLRPSPQGSPTTAPPEVRKRCAQDRDCPTGLMCIRPRVEGAASRPGTCREGDCRDDSDCGPDASCLVVEGGARCVDDGDVRENGECDLGRMERARHCAKNLLCVDNLCLPTCTIGKTGSSCPAGRRCLNDGNGRFCQQSCDPASCRQGERCVTVGVRAFCAIQMGDNCETTGCPNAEACVTIRDRGQVFFECVVECDRDQPCPSGFVCAEPNSERANSCLHSCTRDADCGIAGTCASVGAQQACVRYDPRR